MENSSSITTTTSAGSNVSTATSLEKLDQMANWVSSTVISAFFASLERCSCVNLSTSDDDDDGEEAHHRPLALSAAPHPNDIV